MSIKHRGIKLIGHEERVRDAALMLVEEAVRVFLRAAAPHVPVDTGMSKASLVPLAKSLGVDIPIKPKRTRKGKSPALGMQQQEHRLDIEGDTIIFEWASSVRQYYLNEQFSLRSNDGPWQSLLHGVVKAQQYLNRQGGRILDDAVRKSISYRPGEIF